MIVALAGILTVVFALNSQSCLSRSADMKKESPAPKTIVSPGVEFPTFTPLPSINYEVKAQWSGNNDIEHFENPQIDLSKLQTSDTETLKKTVFKNRKVEVKITIGANGEVTFAKSLSGHPILSEAAVNAAKKSLFNSRSKPTTRVLTYYFRLKDE